MGFLDPITNIVKGGRTVASQTVTTAGGGVPTREDFAIAILAKLGSPQTQSNIQFLLNWMQREGGNAAYNPLNTEMPATGATNYNSVGVKNYTSFDQGVQQTVATLQQGLFSPIRASLSAGSASEDDAAGKFAYALHAWSAGPHAPMSDGYTTVSNVNGNPRTPVMTGGHPSPAGESSNNAGQLSPTALTQYVEANYPQYAYLLHDPQVGPILVQAAQNNVTDPNVLEGMLHDTNWWQHTSSTARQFDEQMAHDPASMNQSLNLETNAVMFQAQQMGVTVSRQQAWQMAVNYLRLGQPPQAISTALSALFKYGNGQGLTGSAATLQQQIKQMYADYVVPVSDQTLAEQVQNLLGQQDATANGQTSINSQQLQSLKDQVAAQAQTLYAGNPGLAQAIKEGQTVQQWADPYKQRAAQLLGTNPNSIDLAAPMWSQILKPATDPKTGQSLGQSQTLDQWETKLRTDPIYGYDHSLNAIQSASQLAAGLKQTLGYGAA